MKRTAGVLRQVVALLGIIAGQVGSALAGSTILPLSSFRLEAGGAEVRTDVRILNQGTTAVTITATFYDQAASTARTAAPFEVGPRNQASFDNVLETLFGRSLGDGAYGPIRFEATGPIVVAASLNNVNACGTGAVTGQWLPGIAETEALETGVIGQLAVSESADSGYRTDVVFFNPGTAPATVTVNVRRGAGALVATGTVGPLAANGFRQVPLDDAETFPGVAGSTDTNLWLEFASDQPVLACASVADAGSGDAYAVVAAVDSGPVPPSADEITVLLPGNVPLVLVRIPAGTFEMGSPTSERGRQADEGPQHLVSIGQGFYIGKYEVTQAQWQAVMGLVPAQGHGTGGDYPVYYVSWNDVAGPGGFVERVNAMLPSARLRLPTEAEWEYAARAGTTTPFSFGDDPSCSLAFCGDCALFNQYMWCSGSLTGYGSRPVGEKDPNPWGLYDVHGNVWEWVQDCYHASYAGAPADGSAWLVPSSSRRVVRSGSWHVWAKSCRSANRGDYPSDNRQATFGFRLARSLD